MIDRDLPETFASLLDQCLDRRRFLRGCAQVAAAGAATGSAFAGDGTPAVTPQRGPAFEGLPLSTADELQVPPGYTADVLLAWGDPLFPDTPAFSLDGQTAELQRRRFGFNCDFNAFFPLRPGGSDEGLICANHEFTSGKEMFRGFDPKEQSPEEVEIQLAAHGMSIAEIRRDPSGPWRVRLDSPRNRRITADTPMLLTGPAAGSPWMRTKDNPSGTRVQGMLSNCAGGKTPWGSVLTCEERTHEYFSNNAQVTDEAVRAGYRRYSMSEGVAYYPWAPHHERFDMARHPNEAHRFGWVVEINPYDPDSVPKKRTALGRFGHESASVGLANDGRVVVYSGDDNPFDYLYKFVSAERFLPGDHAHNADLLDRGTLYVAKFASGGTGEWRPLTPHGPLAEWSQARILVHARLAADLLEATPMDRPEDIDVNPLNHRVYVCMTNNSGRKEGDGGPNPRAENQHGHVVEIDEAGGDLASRRFAWSPFLLCGPPDSGARYAGCDLETIEPVSCPDNITFDRDGTLWLATDGQGRGLAANDSIYAIPTGGPERGRPRRFLNGPVGCEICGPEFTPDFRTLFANVQHPGAYGGLVEPTSTWPRGRTGEERDAGFPRPSLLAVRRLDGGRIGR